MRLINAEVPLEHCREMERYNNDRKDCAYAEGYASAIDFAIEQINSAPTIEVEPVRHGRWVYDSGFWTCTRCGYDEPCRDEDDPDRPKFKRCPDCGAKMDEERVVDV